MFECSTDRTSLGITNGRCEEEIVADVNNVGVLSLWCFSFSNIIIQTL